MGAHADGRTDAQMHGARWMVERAPAAVCYSRLAASKQAAYMMAACLNA